VVEFSYLRLSFDCVRVELFEEFEFLIVGSCHLIWGTSYVCTGCISYSKGQDCGEGSILGLLEVEFGWCESYFSR
jgi:hypothetical protein